MQEKTKLDVYTAIQGLTYSSERIEQALSGKKRKRANPRQDSDHSPFAQALTRVAEIADGAPITDKVAIQQDLLFLFDLLHFLRGGFYNSAWSVLSRAHALVADRISKQEAAAILGEPDFMVDIAVRLENLHPLEGEDGTPYYARYQVEALKATRDAGRKRLKELNEPLDCTCNRDD